MIEGSPTWQAKVVYGDTDSLFVHLPGRTRAEAFAIGEEMSKAVTAANPDPVTLKFEKVYHPCMMITKKRYVGYSWERSTQTEPKFDAKGIETVRRDQCAATAHIMEALLRCVFDSRGDIPQLRRYFEEQALKLLRHDINPVDLILRREVKLGTYVSDSTLPPAARVALQKIQRDAASGPLYGERVPYLVVHGQSDKLMDLVQDPLRVLRREIPFTVHVEHYMTKHILPSLARVFHLVGADFNAWYQQLPRRTHSSALLFSTEQLLRHREGGWQMPGLLQEMALERSVSVVPVGTGGANEANLKKLDHARDAAHRATIHHFAQANRCSVCQERPSCTKTKLPPVCRSCLHPATARSDAAVRVAVRRCRVEASLRALEEQCRQCAWSRTGDIEDVLSLTDRTSLGCIPPLGACLSLDCDSTFQIARLRDLRQQLRLLEDFMMKCETVAVMQEARPFEVASARPGQRWRPIELD
jgi:DNA polymerase zeta